MASSNKRPLEDLDSAFVATPSPKKSRKQYTTAVKLTIIEEANKTSTALAARHHGVTEAMIRKWRQDQERICGQSNATDASPEEITCLKEGKPGHEAYSEVKIFWKNPLVWDLPTSQETNEDSDELEKNELVIFNDDDDK